MTTPRHHLRAVARHLYRALSGLLLTAVAAAAVAVAILAVQGYVPRIDISDSMAPTLRAGDLIAIKPIPAHDARVGDVVTFADPNRPGATLTHRVVRITPAADGQLTFVTKGDANTGTETWTTASSGQVGLYDGLRLPHVGHVLYAIDDDPIRALAALAVVLIGLTAAKRIARPSRSAERTPSAPQVAPVGLRMPYEQPAATTTGEGR